jgi:4-hydroxy-tetrahydrodipicolinate synthase
LNFTGSICALATPFQADGALDWEAYARLLEYQLTGGTQALVVAGSTGEAHALDDAEHEQLLRYTVERIDGRCPVIAGTGAANTLKTVRATQRAKRCGADAALVVTPYYVRPTQEGLVRHFNEVADHGDLPVILYNVPSRTGCDLLPDTVARLIAHEQIVAIKEARNEPERMQQLLALQGDDFTVLSGDDPTAMRAMLAGARGVISVAANVAPGPFRRLCDAAVRGQRTAASALNADLQALFDLLAAEPNPIPLKWCLHLLGFGTPNPRLPLLPLSTAYRAQAQRVIQPLLAAAATLQQGTAA